MRWILSLFNVSMVREVNASVVRRGLELGWNRPLLFANDSALVADSESCVGVRQSLVGCVTGGSCILIWLK